jgi:hypothetical protein
MRTLKEQEPEPEIISGWTSLPLEHTLNRTAHHALFNDTWRFAEENGKENDSKCSY